MDDIDRVLSGVGFALERTAVPTPEESAAAEAATGFRFPESYRRWRVVVLPAAAQALGAERGDDG